MVAGKRYLFFKLTRGGIRSRRVAIYASPSIGNIARYMMHHGFELPVLTLLAVWALGLTTGLTVDDVWTMTPTVFATTLQIPMGPFDDLAVPPDSLLLPAFAQLSYVMGSVCTGMVDSVGLIKIGGDLQLISGGPMGIIYYPPLPGFIPNSGFSLSTSLNGFNISMEPLPSIPPTAQNLTCISSAGLGFETGRLWYEGGDNQTLSIIVNAPGQSQLYRFNASATIFDGTLQSTGNATEFVPNGITRPKVMPDNQWALDIASLVCNATQPLTGNCFLTQPSLINFSYQLNVASYPFVSDLPTVMGIYWSTALGMAMGAYSSAQWSLPMANVQIAAVTSYSDLLFTVQYGAYVLIANIVVSVIMLVLVVKLRMASRLGADFINATRLLLDPLRNPELFHTPLDDTVDALGNPYMSVSENNEFLLTASLSSEKLGSEMTLDSS